MRLPLLVCLAVALCATGCAARRAERVVSEKELLTPPKFLLEWGRKGTNAGEFTSPIGIAIGPRDELFVAEFNANRVQRFTPQGKFLGQFPVLKNPGGIAVDARGRCYVSSMTQHRVGVYETSGQPVAEWGGKQGAADDEFYQPGGMVMGPDGAVWIADQGNHRVLRIAPEGKLRGKFGTHGSAPGQFGGAGSKGSRFGGPQFLAFDRQGNLYTTEAPGGRIQRLDVTGKPLAAWGDNSDAPGGFGGRVKPERTPLPGPIAVWVDRLGRIWVSATNNRVQLFTPEGRYLLTLGGAGDGPGQFRLPHGMATDSQGNIYVADASNQRIQKFAP